MILIIDCGSTKTPEIGLMLKKLNADFRVLTINKFDLSDTEDADATIISGAPILLTEVDTGPYLKKFEFLSQTNKPVLGICFGHQVLGMVHGSKVKRCEEDRKTTAISLMDSELFYGLDNVATFAEDHCECIELPDSFVLTGFSAICDVEAMQHTTKKLFGVQFHPEVSGNNGLTLFKNFLNICSRE